MQKQMKTLIHKVEKLLKNDPLYMLFIIGILMLAIWLLCSHLDKTTNKSLMIALKSAVATSISMVGFSISAYVFLNNILQRKIVDNVAETETINKFLHSKRKKLSSLIIRTAGIVIIEIAFLCFNLWETDLIPDDFGKYKYICLLCVVLVCLIVDTIFVISLVYFNYSIIDYENGLNETAKSQLSILNEENSNTSIVMKVSEFLTIVNNMEIVLERMAHNHHNALKHSLSDSLVRRALCAGYDVPVKGDYVTNGIITHRHEIADKYDKIIEYRNYLLYGEGANDNINVCIGDIVASTANLIFSECLAGEILSDISLNWLTIQGANLEKTVFRHCFLQHISFTGKSTLEGVDFKDSVLSNVDLRGANCKNVNFSNTRLLDVKFDSSTNLESTIFENADLSGLKKLGTSSRQDASLCIEHANLTRANMINMNICDTKFDNSIMMNVQLYNSKIGESSLFDSNTSFKFVNLQEAIMMSCRIFRSCFQNANLESANLAYSLMYKIDFSECRFTSATLTESGINSCSFEKAYCDNISFKGTIVSNSIFNNSTMISADFSGAELSKVQLNGAVCRNSLFVETRIKDSSFERCVMSNIRLASKDKIVIEKTNFNFVNFSDSSISNVEFVGCNFTGVDFSSSRLINVDFVECEGLDTVRFADVWMDTVNLGTYKKDELENEDIRKLRFAFRYCRNVTVGIGKEYISNKILPESD
jgi:uncharacterized protein YjbI with pentapeptide repeats